MKAQSNAIQMDRTTKRINQMIVQMILSKEQDMVDSIEVFVCNWL